LESTDFKLSLIEKFEVFNFPVGTDKTLASGFVKIVAFGEETLALAGFCFSLSRC